MARRARRQRQPGDTGADRIRAPHEPRRRGRHGSVRRRHLRGQSELRRDSGRGDQGARRGSVRRLQHGRPVHEHRHQERRQYVPWVGGALHHSAELQRVERPGHSREQTRGLSAGLDARRSDRARQNLVLQRVSPRADRSNVQQRGGARPEARQLVVPEGDRATDQRPPAASQLPVRSHRAGERALPRNRRAQPQSRPADQRHDDRQPRAEQRHAANRRAVGARHPGQRRAARELQLQLGRQLDESPAAGRQLHDQQAERSAAARRPGARPHQDHSDQPARQHPGEPDHDGHGGRLRGD